MIFNSVGLMLIYFIVFADTLKSLIIDLTSVTENDFMGKRQAYVIILAAVLIPVILKKEMQEFKIISILLFVALFCFIVLIII